MKKTIFLFIILLSVISNAQNVRRLSDGSLEVEKSNFKVPNNFDLGEATLDEARMLCDSAKESIQIEGSTDYQFSIKDWFILMTEVTPMSKVYWEVSGDNYKARKEILPDKIEEVNLKFGTYAIFLIVLWIVIGACLGFFLPIESPIRNVWENLFDYYKALLIPLVLSLLISPMLDLEASLVVSCIMIIIMMAIYLIREEYEMPIVLGILGLVVGGFVSIIIGGCVCEISGVIVLLLMSSFAFILTSIGILMSE